MSRNLMNSPKPPSILIYTKDDETKYKKLHDTLVNVLPDDTYTIFYLDTNVLKSTTWIESSTACLILSGIEELESECIETIRKYVEGGGKIMTEDSTSEKIVKEINDNHSVFKNFNNNISTTLKEVGLMIDEEHNENTKKLSTAYLISDNEQQISSLRGMIYNNKFGGSPKLLISPSFPEELEKVETSEELIKIKVLSKNEKISTFNVSEYMENLQTNKIGKLLIHTDVCTTTLDISKGLSEALPTNEDPIVVTANYQTSGVGRSGNQWLSPKGCLMFSFNYTVSWESKLSKKLTFIQHVLAVAIVDAIRTVVGAHDIPLKIKWPNDIYWDRKYKIGGILVRCSTLGNNYRCILGAGVDLANEKPTVCINQFLRESFNMELSKEKVLAEIMNKFEMYMDIFEERDYKGFLEFYYKHWLHTDEEVFVHGESKTQEDADEDELLDEYCVIRGLNEYGYLRVIGKQSGIAFSVCDNGNTFDMMKGLIKTKFV
uniref:BPL/LPL catalytic domain-containing protein n=1 Tax=Parastrongyloides trichosuri TaxID=131310 RepID=A0A0N4Z5Y4_PARTI